MFKYIFIYLLCHNMPQFGATLDWHCNFYALHSQIAWRLRTSTFTVSMIKWQISKNSFAPSSLVSNFREAFGMLSLTLCHSHCHAKNQNSAYRGGWVQQHPRGYTGNIKRAKTESRNFKENKLLAHCFCTQERSLYLLKTPCHCLFNYCFFPPVPSSSSPSHPLSPLTSLPFSLFPSRSMFLQTCVFVTLCWSSPCQCGPCRRCWLTLGRTAKGWVPPSFPLIAHHSSLCLKHTQHLHTQTHTCTHVHKSICSLPWAQNALEVFYSVSFS